MDPPGIFALAHLIYSLVFFGNFFQRWRAFARQMNKVLGDLRVVRYERLCRPSNLETCAVKAYFPVVVRITRSLDANNVLLRHVNAIQLARFDDRLDER
jgi:hypothetical protein